MLNFLFLIIIFREKQADRMTEAQITELNEFFNSLR